MPQLTPDQFPVPAMVPRIPVDQPVAMIERPHQHRPGTVPGVAPLVWPGPEPYYPEIDEDRPTGPYRVTGVDPYWLGKIMAGSMPDIKPRTLPVGLHVPSIAIAPWRVPMVVPPQRIGPYTMRVHGGGIA